MVRILQFERARLFPLSGFALAQSPRDRGIFETILSNRMIRPAVAEKLPGFDHAMARKEPEFSDESTIAASGMGKKGCLISGNQNRLN
jgi:hypothetical protein